MTASNAGPSWKMLADLFNGIANDDVNRRSGVRPWQLFSEAAAICGQHAAEQEDRPLDAAETVFIDRAREKHKAAAPAPVTPAPGEGTAQANCEHDPDDAGNTCCTCGKVLTNDERMAYERRLRARLPEVLANMKSRISRDFAAMFLDTPGPSRPVSEPVRGKFDHERTSETTAERGSTGDGAEFPQQAIRVAPVQTECRPQGQSAGPSPVLDSKAQSQ